MSFGGFNRGRATSLSAKSVSRAESAGRTAYWQGKKYEDNPYTTDKPGLRLAWSQGHNNARVQDAQRGHQPR